MHCFHEQPLLQSFMKNQMFIFLLLDKIQYVDM